MSNIYHLVSNGNDINLQVRVGTIGNASTVATRHRAGGSFEEVAKSTKSAAGNIPQKKIGISSELIGSTLVVDTAILLDGIPKEQLDQTFENLFLRVTLFGGLDGEQFFDIVPSEKKQFMEKRLIVASKAIKLVPQPQ
jgi:hypothetical protein